MRLEMHSILYSENLKDKGYLGDLVVYDKAILNLILEK
jgi:hypothetical protein